MSTQMGRQQTHPVGGTVRVNSGAPYLILCA